jgi:hypothetical protein
LRGKAVSDDRQQRLRISCPAFAHVAAFQGLLRTFVDAVCSTRPRYRASWLAGRWRDPNEESLCNIFQKRGAFVKRFMLLEKDLLS